MPQRCPKGTRRNKKTGNCEKKTTTTNNSKRCPKGTRRNKKTGNCEKTVTKKNTNEIIFRFKPQLKSTTKFIDTEPHMEKIVNWYKKFAIEHADVEDAKLVNIIDDDKKIVITLSYTDSRSVSDIITLIEEIVNPDEDGNHPLKISGKEYLVNGKNIERKQNGSWIQVE